MTDIEVVDLDLVAPVTVECVARTEATDRAITFVVDKPPTLGGTDRGPMPSEYFLAALASCTMMTARKVADKRKVSYRGIRCRSLAYFEGSDIAKVELQIVVESPATQTEWDTVFRLAERSCTIMRVTKCPVEQTVTVEP